VRKAITAFVEKYNDLMNYLNQQTAYNPKTQRGGPLFGNRTAIQIQDELRRLVSNTVPGLAGTFNRLSALGISLTDRGTLELDSARLDQVLSGQMPGVTLEDVSRLFAFTGRSNNAGISFVVGSVKTDSSGLPIQVDITQAAEQASVLAASSLAASTVIDSSNQQLSIEVDGKRYDILLSPGTYSRQRLAEELQARINVAALADGRQVSVTVEGDKLRIRSQSYGSRSQIHLVGGTALAALGFSAGQQDSGQDVAGVFIVNGQIETARGVGQLLIADENNRYTSGLQVRVTLSASQLVSGAEGEVILTRGVTANLDRYLAQVLDPVSGLIKNGREALEGEAQRLQESMDRINRLIQQQRESLEARFRNLEDMVARLRSVGDILTLQFQALLNNNTRLNRR
jgi:flagellar hook-associated protein 2